MVKALWEALMSKTAFLSIWLAAAFLVGCESMHMAEERDEALMKPVDCATAQGDLRVLEGEKNHVMAQKAAGASTVSPSSAVLGSGPAGGVTEEGENAGEIAEEQSNVQIQIDRYEQAVNEKIAKIKSTCGL